MKTFYYTFFIAMLILSCNQNNAQVNNKIELQDEITISEIHQAYQNKEYNVQDVVEFYLNRIETIDKNGPSLNSVLTINPDAMEIAKQLDAMENGMDNLPLYGIPILLKDNIDTKDKMPCTAGARCMAKSFPLQDSPIAKQLRDAGAVILGKANLSEWANFHSNHSSSGWSGLGGQTHNPYDLTRNPCGSSAGSGVAVSANISVLAIGTETNGSIVCPSNNNGIVGIKPTVGLVSRSGVVPISFTQDTGGPMARTVEDAVKCLNVLTDADENDAATMQEDRDVKEDYTIYLKAGGMKGKRIGVFPSNAGDNVQVMKVFNEAAKAMEESGAVLVPIDKVMEDAAGGASFQVLLYEFKDGLNKYFASLGSDAVVKDLEDLIAQTFSDKIEMEFHDHELLKIANAKAGLNEKEYIEAREKALRLSREEGIDKVMKEHNLDAIIAPAGGPAWKTDIVNGDNYGIYSSSPAAIAGYPNICVPMGDVHGLPIGLNIFGQKWQEAKLIEIAYAYEQLSKKRITPSFKNGN
ncbi:MAG: amidase [Bacteroidota bacterium]